MKEEKDLRVVSVTVVCTRSKTFEVEIPEKLFSVEQDETGSFVEYGNFTQLDLISLIEKKYGHDFDYCLEDWEEDNIELIYEG